MRRAGPTTITGASAALATLVLAWGLVATALAPAAGAAASTATSSATSAAIPTATTTAATTATVDTTAVVTRSYHDDLSPWQEQTITVTGGLGTYALRAGDATTVPLATTAPACRPLGVSDGPCDPASVEAALRAAGLAATVTDGPTAAGFLPLLRYRVHLDDPGATPLIVVDAHLQPAGATVTADCVWCLDTERDAPVAANGGAVVYVHGGGFVNGSREGDGWPDARARFEGAGYRTFSIDYRVLDPIPAFFVPAPFGALCDWGVTDPTEACAAWLDAAADAQADVDAAVAWVRAHAVELGVDPARLAVLGFSAGAIAALNNHYAPLTPEGAPAATISLSGIMDTARQQSAAGPVLLFSFGGVDTAYAGTFLTGIDGEIRNEDVLERARLLGNDATLRTLPGPGHDVTTASPFYEDVIATTLSFLDTHLPAPATAARRAASPATFGADGVWLGAPDGIHPEGGHTTPVAAGTPTTAVTGDFNGDGRVDVIWDRSGAAPDMIWFGDAGGVLRDPREWSVDGSTYVPAVTAGAAEVATVADVDGDRIDDVVWYDPATGDATLWTGARDGRFTTTALGALPPHARLAAADVDGDGRHELVATEPDLGRAEVWRVVGGAVVATPLVDSLVAGAEPVIGDFDGDGRTDVYWHGLATDPLRTFDPVTGEWRAVAAPVVAPAMVATTGDFDGDGTTDVVWYDPTTGAGLQLWYGRRPAAAPTTTAAFLVVPVGNVVRGLEWRAADLNGDGHQDLVAYWAPLHGAVVFAAGGTAQFSVASVRVGLPDGADPVVGDLDGNGSSDILWAH